jgi:hypothetical protein
LSNEDLPAFRYRTKTAALAAFSLFLTSFLQIVELAVETTYSLTNAATINFKFCFARASRADAARLL